MGLQPMSDAPGTTHAELLAKIDLFAHLDRVTLARLAAYLEPRIITLLATASMWFLPAQTTSYLVAYSASEGRLYSHAQARRVGYAYVVVTLAGLALSVPYWRFIGLLQRRWMSREIWRW